MNDKLNILWTTDNKDTIFNMLAMYTLNSKKRGWWQEVNVILWGASVKLAAQDTQIQTEILEMLQTGVTVEACQDCCERFGVKPVIEKLGVTVRYMGAPLTEYLKNGEKVLTICKIYLQNKLYFSHRNTQHYGTSYFKRQKHLPHK